MERGFFGVVAELLTGFFLTTGFFMTAGFFSKRLCNSSSLSNIVPFVHTLQPHSMALHREL